LQNRRTLFNFINRATITSLLLLKLWKEGNLTEHAVSGPKKIPFLCLDRNTLKKQNLMTNSSSLGNEYIHYDIVSKTYLNLIYPCCTNQVLPRRQLNYSQRASYAW
jgi:hypothetical protein